MRFRINRVEEIEDQVKSLTAEELKAFRDWFAAFDGDACRLLSVQLRDYKIGRDFWDGIPHSVASSDAAEISVGTAPCGRGSVQ